MSQNAESERVWTYHTYTPNADNSACLCGFPKDHPSHGPAQIDRSGAAVRSSKVGRCQVCGLTYDVEEEVPVTMDAFTCDSCGGEVEVIEVWGDDK